MCIRDRGQLAEAVKGGLDSVMGCRAAEEEEEELFNDEIFKVWYYLFYNSKTPLNLLLYDLNKLNVM